MYARGFSLSCLFGFRCYSSIFSSYSNPLLISFAG